MPSEDGWNRGPNAEERPQSWAGQGGQVTLWHLELCKGHWRRLLAWPSPHQQGLFTSAGYAQTFKPASPSGPCPPHLCTALSIEPSLQIGTLRQILCRGLYPPWVLEGESRGLPTRGLIKAATGVKIQAGSQSCESKSPQQ